MPDRGRSPTESSAEESSAEESSAEESSAEEESAEEELEEKRTEERRAEEELRPVESSQETAFPSAWPGPAEAAASSMGGTASRQG